MMKRLTVTVITVIMGACSIMAQEPYKNAGLTAEERARDLMSRLTLNEKVKLMMDQSPAIERLQVPTFQWWNEALHGIGRNGFATVFPITMAMAASWDDEMVHRVFTAVSDEGRVKARQAKAAGSIARYQSLSFWTPNINIFRDPRWGRGQETYGEDPLLTARMGLAVVRGLQGMTYDGKWINPKYKKLLACAKHFAVHSGPEWNRHTFDIEQLPERDLWETYLPAFKALVQQGEVAEVMCAYQRIDGQPCCSQHRYEQQILRQEWGFKGLITSDCGAVRDFLPQWHNTARDNSEAAAQAVGAGTDVECGSVYKALPEAVRRGDISESDIDRSLLRLLTARFEVGDFDSDDLVSWTQTPDSVVASQKHKQLALDMGRKSIVLLKNSPLQSRGNFQSTGSALLPLRLEGAVEGLVVMGPNANDSVMQWGNYAGYPTKTVTALEGLRRVLGPGVRYVQGCGLTRNEVSESRYHEISTDGGRPGMQAVYWNNDDMEGDPVATVTMTEPVALSNGGNTVFAPGVRLEHFSAQYKGTFTPTRDEKVLFTISGDDKMRLMVDGDTIVDMWKVRHRIQNGQKEMSVKAGRTYTLQIDYVQEEGYAALNFDIVHKATPTPQQLLAQVGDAEVVVFVGGISPRLEGEEMKVSEPGFRGGDRTSIELPQAQRDVLRTLHEAGKKVVLVNCSGGAVAMVPEMETCDAIVQWWYGGEQGGAALADVLTGRYNPSGKLPVTFYRSTDDLPDFLDYTMTNRTYRYFKGEPLFPFGYGLSYTTFAMRGGKVKHNSDGSIDVSVKVKNTGTMDGTETVQVYFRRTDDTDGPLKTLCGYKQVELKKGEERVVRINIPREQLETWDAGTNTMRCMSGRYQIMVGASSADNDLLTINTKW